MKAFKFILVGIFSMVVSCSSHAKLTSKYIVLIGEFFRPNFESIKIGGKYGSDKNLMAYSKGHFGKLKIDHVDHNKGVFTEGGVVLNLSRGKLKLSGDLKLSLKVLVLKSEDQAANVYTVVDKRIINKGEDFLLVIDLD